MSRRQGWFAFALILPVGAGVLLLGWLVDPPLEPDAPPEATTVQPVGGSAVCPVGDGREGGDLQATVARPLDAGEEPAEAELEIYEAGERTGSSLPRLLPGSAVQRAPELGEAGALGLTWREGPAVLHREWTLDGEDDEVPAGIVAGGCPAALSDQWIIPGMVTSGGSQAILRITNPYPTDATIGLRFVGTDGPVAPIALRNLSVEGRSTLEIDVNEFLPERDDLTAVVDVASGRVATQGIQLVRSAIGGIDGVSVLDAATEPSESWTLPWVVDREGAASWLWIYNPSDRVAPVELTYHTEEGGELPDGLSEVLVDPGQLRRVDLRGTFPEDDEVVAVTARSDGAPVVVSNAVELGADDEERTAFTVQLGVPESDTNWTVSGGNTEGRVEQLHLVNPGSEPAEATISLFAGASLEQPEELTDITVPPGGRATVPVVDGETELDGWTAFVAVDTGELVVGRVGGAGEGPRGQVAVPGMPSSSWLVTSADQHVVRAEGMVHRLRTELGIAPGEEAPVPAPPAEPDPGDEPLAPPSDEDPDAPEDPEDEVDEPAEDDLPAEEVPDVDAEDPATEEAPAEDAEDAEDAEGEEAGEEAPAGSGNLPGDGPGAGAGEAAVEEDEEDGDEDNGDDEDE